MELTAALAIREIQLTLAALEKCILLKLTRASAAMAGERLKGEEKKMNVQHGESRRRRRRRAKGHAALIFNETASARARLCHCNPAGWRGKNMLNRYPWRNHRSYCRYTVPEKSRLPVICNNDQSLCRRFIRHI